MLKRYEPEDLLDVVVTPNLLRCFSVELDNGLNPQPVTLQIVLNAMYRGLIQRLRLNDDDTIYSEIDDLIVTYGEDCCVTHFVRDRVS